MERCRESQARTANWDSPCFCIPGCGKHSKSAREKFVRQKKEIKDTIKQKIKINSSIKLQHSTKTLTQGLAMEGHSITSPTSTKEEIANIPKSNTMTEQLFIVKEKILKLREVRDMFEVDRRKIVSGKQRMRQLNCHCKWLGMVLIGNLFANGIFCFS